MCMRDEQSRRAAAALALSSPRGFLAAWRAARKGDWVWLAAHGRANAAEVEAVGVLACHWEKRQRAEMVEPFSRVLCI